ncbi:MAG: ABC transporter ATP-binding protein [Acidimicrobiia bacterium]
MGHRRAGGAGVNDLSLEIAGLEFGYPDGTDVLHGVDLVVGPGERVALLGPNGAGKTTLVLHLVGILRGRSGTVRVGGLELADATVMEIRRRVGLVFQDPDDQLFMPTVHQDVAFGPANFGLTGSELAGRVEEALAAVAMGGVADRAPHHLSGGERRRVAIATVLAMRPQMLVLDEPTSNLDPAGRRELVDVLRSLAITTLIVTHDLPFALELCPRSVIINGGSVVADGATRDLLSDAALMKSNRLELPYGFDPAFVPDAPG